ncbi:hypothetical protein BV25DRAFT_1203789 [Artomyces pyxidatus]|uniref:Uncharacterized protein n=1 Tax=Artomyces pyxidatus TaxID=48021 RepID=A0ACB8SQK3_9AGAM|nr:hypothetical protein BV25DRAFT_1203789 [Artomyces pyxidatus]
MRVRGVGRERGEERRGSGRVRGRGREHKREWERAHGGLQGRQARALEHLVSIMSDFYVRACPSVHHPAPTPPSSPADSTATTYICRIMQTTSLSGPHTSHTALVARPPPRLSLKAHKNRHSRVWRPPAKEHRLLKLMHHAHAPDPSSSTDISTTSSQRRLLPATPACRSMLRPRYTRTSNTACLPCCYPCSRSLRSQSSRHPPIASREDTEEESGAGA